MDSRQQNLLSFMGGAMVGAAVGWWISIKGQQNDRPVIVVSNSSVDFEPLSRRDGWVQIGPREWFYKVTGGAPVTAMDLDVVTGGGAQHRPGKRRCHLRFRGSNPPLKVTIEVDNGLRELVYKFPPTATVVHDAANHRLSVQQRNCDEVDAGPPQAPDPIANVPGRFMFITHR